MQPTEPIRTETTDVHRLLHRWFVEYNPFYLVSAALCIAGLRLTSLGLAERGSVFGDVGIGGVTELYAFALIGGAALLMRLGQRRPAVMLSLLAVLYQGDITFHLEASSYLRGAGIVASAGWVAIFMAKLYALTRTMRLRVSRSAMVLAAYGGFGLAVVPQIVVRMATESRGAVVALWVFSVVALGIHGSPRIDSSPDLDAWGHTVLRRSVRGTWMLWTLLLGVHVYFWSTTYPLSLAALVPAGLLLGTRFVRRELHAWAAVAAVLVVVARVEPQLFSLTALMAAAMLAVRAYRQMHATMSALQNAVAPPFRVGHVDVAPPSSAPMLEWSLAPTTPDARRRLLVGALFATYLATWTMHWSGGPWPLHVLWLDLVVTGAALTLAMRSRVLIALAPLAASYAHFLVQTHLVSAPRTTLQWGVSFTGGAFALLLGSLAASYWLRHAHAWEAVPRSDGERG